MKDTKTYPLIIGLLVPVLMVIFIAGSVFVQRLLAPSAQYDFIYSVSDGYNPGTQYWVDDGKIQMRDIKGMTQNQARYTTVRLYRHYVKENKSVGISLEEAGKLILSDATQSPDGFEISPGTQGSSFLFFYSSYADYSEMYLKGHGVGQRLNLVKGQRPYYSYNDFHFVGWVVP